MKRKDFDLTGIIYKSEKKKRKKKTLATAWLRELFPPCLQFGKNS